MKKHKDFNAQPWWRPGNQSTVMVASLHLQNLFPTGERKRADGHQPIEAWGNYDDSCESSPACLASLGIAFLTAGLELPKSLLITQSFISPMKFKERFWFYCYHFWYNFISSLSISCYERAKVMELDVLCLKVSLITLTETPLACEFQSQKKTTGFWLACIHCSAGGRPGSRGRGPATSPLFILPRWVGVWEF